MGDWANGSEVGVGGPLLLSGTVSSEITVAASLPAPHASPTLLALLQHLNSVTVGSKTATDYR